MVIMVLLEERRKKVSLIQHVPSQSSSNHNEPLELHGFPWYFNKYNPKSLPKWHSGTVDLYYASSNFFTTCMDS